MMQLIPKRNPELIASYLMEAEQDGCELFHRIEGESWDRVLERFGWPNPDTYRLIPHHIFGGPHRWDIATNIVAVSEPAHRWCHWNRQQATILCLWVKVAVRGDFDRELMRECLGFDPIGKIEGYDMLDEWAEFLRMDIYERVSER